MDALAHSITVNGWVATNPRPIEGSDALTSFRLASTARRDHLPAELQRDGATEWFTVRAVGVTASNVLRSIEKGQPVIVSGPLRTVTRMSDSGERCELVIDVQAVGHDLTRGIATFTRGPLDDN